jgi:hypothetical protein
MLSLRTTTQWEIYANSGEKKQTFWFSTQSYDKISISCAMYHVYDSST